MLSLRVWIITALIVLAAIGAYVVWATRARVNYTSRSLSAAPPATHTAANSATHPLHIDGCNDDFIVKTGELVEPRVVPGAPIEDFRRTYGKETHRDKSGITTWDPNPFTLSEGSLGPDRSSSFVALSVNQGHVVETLDGIELGIDSLGTVFRKMRDRGVETHERVIHGDGSWTLVISFYSTCARKYRSEYSRTFPATPEIDSLVTPHPPVPDPGKPAPPPGTPAKPLPWRSDFFLNKVVTQYTLVPSNGHDDSIEGSPSDHN